MCMPPASLIRRTKKSPRTMPSVAKEKATRPNALASFRVLARVRGESFSLQPLHKRGVDLLSSPSDCSACLRLMSLRMPLIRVGRINTSRASTHNSLEASIFHLIRDPLVHVAAAGTGPLLNPDTSARGPCVGDRHCRGGVCVSRVHTPRPGVVYDKGAH